MTEKKKVSKAKPPAKKAAGKKKAPGMSSRAKIRKYCEVVKVPNQLGCVLVYGKHQFRMNRDLDKLTDAECDKVLKKLDKLFEVLKNAGGKQPAKRRTVVTTTDPKPCECGCRVMTRKGSRFLPGHDMKLKSALKKAAAGGDSKAKKELVSRGWVQAGT